MEARLGTGWCSSAGEDMSRQAAGIQLGGQLVVGWGMQLGGQLAVGWGMQLGASGSRVGYAVYGIIHKFWWDMQPGTAWAGRTPAAVGQFRTGSGMHLGDSLGHCGIFQL